VFINTNTPGALNSWVNSHPEIDPLGSLNASSGQIAGFRTSNPGTAPIVDVFTVTPKYLGCTGSSINFSITVKPTPTLASTNRPAGVCNGLTFTSHQDPTIAGTTFSWSRAAVGTMNDTAAHGDIIEPFVNLGTTPLGITYFDTLRLNGCVNTVTLTTTAYPTPYLNTAAPAPICDNSLFSYIPTSTTGSNTSFAWSRDAIYGLSNLPATGANDPSEILSDTTSSSVEVVYTYTLTTASPAGCVNIQQITDTVRPNPILSIATYPLTYGTYCDSQMVQIIPSSRVTGATFIWVRDSIAGIRNSSATNSDTATEWLKNVTAHPVVDTYFYTTSINVCSNTERVLVTVNPTPKLIGSHVHAPVCDSALVSYNPNSFTTPITSFMWQRNAMTGILNSAATGSNNPMEYLVNTTPLPIVDTYHYTITAFGCTNMEDITVQVNPKPVFTNKMPASICDSATLNFTPTSGTTPFTYRWYRKYVPGILDAAAIGTTDPNEELINTTNVPVTAVYIYTVTANGCSNTQVDSVSVNPTPLFTSAATSSVCSGAPFSYSPSSFTPGATFAWVRNTVPHITPGTALGNGNINETMINDTLIPVNVTYLYRLGINGCINNHTDKLVVTVKANPPIPQITITSPSSVCSNTMYQNFGASSPVPVQYSWSADNAQVWATGNTRQYAIVNFNEPGTAVVKLTSNLPGVACMVDNTYTVTVTSNVSDDPQVIYYDGQFICLQTNEDNYQWGFDDANTLDSTMLIGETNQNYANTNPDFARRYYWVMTNLNGCMQKTYYRVPAGVTEINEVSGINVYPNPTNDNINVDINAKIGGKIEVSVINMLGQKITTVTAVDHKAKISVSSLPSGCYLIDCYRDGVKLAAARFIKN
jgi:hypothetical protein